jgi:hypothetical protein
MIDASNTKAGIWLLRIATGRERFRGISIAKYSLLARLIRAGRRKSSRSLYSRGFW